MTDQRKMDPIETFRADDPDHDMVSASRRLADYHARQNARADRPPVIKRERHPVRDSLAILGATVLLAAGVSWAGSEIQGGAGAPGAAPLEHADNAARAGQAARVAANLLGEPNPVPVNK